MRVVPRHGAPTSRPRPRIPVALDRASSTLYTGERQRMQLARAVRNRTTGVLYVLDEPSIGLHPLNIEGLIAVMDDLTADGNSVILVDHDLYILSNADEIVELGSEAGAGGGRKCFSIPHSAFAPLAAHSPILCARQAEHLQCQDERGDETAG